MKPPVAAPGASKDVRSLRLGEGVWAVFGQVGTGVAMLAGTRALTEVVPPAVYGSVSLLLAAMTLGRETLCLPLLQAAMRHYPELARRGALATLRATVAVGMRKNAALLVLASLGGGALYAGIASARFLPFVALAALLAADVLRAIEFTYVGAARAQRKYAWSLTAEAIAKPACALAAVALLGVREEVVLLGYVAATLVTWAIVREQGRPARGSPDAALARELAAFARPLVPLGIVVWVSSLSDRYILGALLDTPTVGAYAAAYGLMSLPFLMARGTLTLAVRPLYFEAVSAGDRAGAAKVLRAWLLASAGIGAAGVLGVVVVREWIARFALAAEYRWSASLMPWIALGYGISICAYPFEMTLHAYKRTRPVLFVQTVVALVSVAVTVPLVRQYGAAGAAWAAPLYFSVQLALFALVVARVRREESRA